MSIISSTIVCYKYLHDIETLFFSLQLNIRIITWQLSQGLTEVCSDNMCKMGISWKPVFSRAAGNFLPHHAVSSGKIRRNWLWDLNTCCPHQSPPLFFHFHGITLSLFLTQDWEPLLEGSTLCRRWEECLWTAIIAVTKYLTRGHIRVQWPRVHRGRECMAAGGTHSSDGGIWLTARTSRKQRERNACTLLASSSLFRPNP